MVVGAWWFVPRPWNFCRSTTNNQEPGADPFRPKSGEFPPLEKAHCYRGELVFVDHANRRGSLRVAGDGKFYRNDPQSWRSAASSARDSARDLPERLAAIALIAEVPEAKEVLLEQLDATQVPEVQEATLRGLRLHDSDNFAQEVILRWRGLSPSFRPQLIQWSLRRTSGRVAVLDALDAKQITVQELNLDLEQRRTLLRWSSGAIAKRAKSYFGDEEYSNRKALVEEWLGKLPASGDITIGKKLFETHCALCHQAGSLGKNVGPNLTGVSHRSVEDLLSHI